MGNKASYEEPDSYLYEPIKDFSKDTTEKNYKLKKFPILKPTEEADLERINIEYEILQLSNLKEKEIWIEDIPINFYGDNYLHTIRAQENRDFLDKKKPTMIMVHGFMASCSHYIKMLKNFYKDFNVYAIDMIGMGFSSRPQPKFDCSKAYINFFVDSLEAFREKIFENYSEEDNKNIYLIGHSLGGYMSTNYAMKYPKYITKLFLLSPVGITDMKNNLEEDNDGSTMGRKVIDSIICLIWPLRTTFQNLINCNFLFRNFLYKGLLNRYMIPEEERITFRNLSFHTLTQYPKDLDNVIYYVLKLPLPMAIWPLENVMPKRIKNFSVDIIYGTNDWMESKGANRFCKRDGYGRFNLFFMRGGRHTFNLERPEDASRYIIEGIKRDKIMKEMDLNSNNIEIDNEKEIKFLTSEKNNLIRGKEIVNVNKINENLNNIDIEKEREFDNEDVNIDPKLEEMLKNGKVEFKG